MTNPKIKSEAMRALANIKSYELKVFAITVNLMQRNLVDIEEENDKKGKVKKGTNSDLNDSETVSTVPETDDFMDCLNYICTEAPNCSVLLISESGTTTLRIIAKSRNSSLSSLAWCKAAANNTASTITKEITDDTLAQAQVTVEMKEGASTIKEKENALAASFAYLRSQGLCEESDDEDEEQFTLSDYPM
jgi:hypothetical protein